MPRWFRRFLSLTLLLLIAFAYTASAQHNRHDPRVLREDPRLARDQIAPVLKGLGEHSRDVSTQSERTQLFFDQGLRLTYGFNHREALRAFKEAVRLEPQCAMAYWGWALVLGPNLNLPMQPEVIEQAYKAIQLAVENKQHASAREGELIDALATRYSNDLKADRATLDSAYASAMKALYAKYPDDSDIATLYAAALMNLSPWNYWAQDGTPLTRTNEFLAVLESVMQRDPKHEGALHYKTFEMAPGPPRSSSALATRRPC